MAAEEIFQLCSLASVSGNSDAFALPGWRMVLGPIAVQVYTTQATAFVGTVKLQGTIASDVEIANNTAHWSDIDGASWTTETIDALFAKTPYIRASIATYTSGQISVRMAY